MVNYISLTPCDVGRLMAQHQSHMKKCLEFENNTISCMTFAGAANNVGQANYTYISSLYLCVFYTILPK